MKKYLSIYLLGLRISGLALKFILLLYMAKKYSIEDVGVYGLVFSVVLFSVTLTGFELYGVTARKIKRLKSAKHKADALDLHYGIINLGYVASVPFIFLSLKFYGLDGVMALEIVLLVYLELILQEIYRLLLTVGDVVNASNLMFFKSSAWVVFLILFNEIFTSTRNVNSLITIWLIMQICVALYAVYVCSNISWIRAVKPKIDLVWAKKALIKVLPLYIALISFRSVFTGDKYLLGLAVSEYAVGIYFLVLSFAVSAMTLVESTVYARYFSKMLSVSVEGKEKSFRLVFSKYRKDTVLYSAIIFMAVFSIMIILSYFINIGDVFDYIYIAILLFLSLLLIALSQTYYLIMFVKGSLMSIMISSLAFMVVYFMSTFMISGRASLISFSLVLLISSFILFLTRRKFALAILR